MSKSDSNILSLVVNNKLSTLKNYEIILLNLLHNNSDSNFTINDCANIGTLSKAELQEIEADALRKLIS